MVISSVDKMFIVKVSRIYLNWYLGVKPIFTYIPTLLKKCELKIVETYKSQIENVDAFRLEILNYLSENRINSVSIFCIRIFISLMYIIILHKVN